MADEIVTLASIYVLLLDDPVPKKRKKVKRSSWIHPWMARREERGFYHQLFQEISAEDTPAFFELMRMNKTHFHYLVETLSCKLSRKDTIMRKSIKPAEICCLALRFLATGESFRSLHFQFRLGRQTISTAITDCIQGDLRRNGTIISQNPKFNQRVGTNCCQVRTEMEFAKHPGCHRWKENHIRAAK